MNYRKLCTPSDHLLSRRHWLGVVGALGLGALAGPARADEPKKKQKQVLFIWLAGGVSQLETWDPKPDTKFGGPFRSIPTALPGVRVSELLPRCARLLDRLVVVRSMSTKDNSHTTGAERIQRGDPKNRGLPYPYFGAAAAKLLGGGDGGLPPYVAVQPGAGGFLSDEAGFLGPDYAAVAFGDGKPPDDLLRNGALTPADDADRNELREWADHRYVQGRRTDGAEAVGRVYDMAARLEKRLDLFDPTTLAPRDVRRYGDSDLGRHLLLARRFLEAGVSCVKVKSLGWDTHGDNFNGSLSLVPKFDQAFAAMIEDLSDRGMLDNVLVIAMSEFGRTPRINGHLGRDHWPEAWSLVMAGAGLKRGAVIGATNDKGTAVAADPYDIGHVFHTWFRALGIDPVNTHYHTHGQRLAVADEDCHAISEALA